MDSDSQGDYMLLQNLPDGFAYHKIITDAAGNPVDFIFLDVNPAFEEITGHARENIIGKTILEILPEIKETYPDWLNIFGRVALNNETVRKELFVELLQRWYEITAYSGKKGYFTALFRDITSYMGSSRHTITRKQTEKVAELISSALTRDISERKGNEQKLADYTQELEQLYHQLDEELDKARQVHERILPTVFPVVEGLSFAAHYRPAQKMGGDFYDVLHTGNKLIFYLSDVSGHGLDGAMLSVFVKHTIKTYIAFSPAKSLTPAAILRHLAEQFRREDYPEELFVCSFMAVLDLNTMELTYCTAGFQEALLVQLGNGQKFKLESKGIFISSYLPLEILELQENSITLTPGSTLFCNTDGLTEQKSKGEKYRDRLPEVFFQNARLPANLVAQSVLEDFRRFNNNSLQGNDDITFLVLQVNEQVYCNPDHYVSEQ